YYCSLLIILIFNMPIINIISTAINNLLFTTHVTPGNPDDALTYKCCMDNAKTQDEKGLPCLVPSEEERIVLRVPPSYISTGVSWPWVHSKYFQVGIGVEYKACAIK